LGGDAPCGVLKKKKTKLGGTMQLIYFLENNFDQTIVQVAKKKKTKLA
jgi:hypothetical protein